MELYACHYDNGEAWEDNYHDIEVIFDSLDKAIKYIKDSGFTEKSVSFDSDSVWRKPKLSEKEIKHYQQLEAKYDKAFDELEEISDTLSEEEKRKRRNEIEHEYGRKLTNWWSGDDNSYYTIEIYELNQPGSSAYMSS